MNVSWEESRELFRPQAVGPASLPGFLENNPWVVVVDRFDDMLEELFRHDNPSLPNTDPDYYRQLDDFTRQYLNGRPKDEAGAWFYYPWRSAVVHVFNESDHQLLRTDRNRDLILKEEQDELVSKKVGVAGLSVGSNVVTALSMTGPLAELRIADFDELTLTNLNRIKAGLCELGLPKTTIAARGIYELDPYARVEVFAEGITEASLPAFLEGLDLVVDEMDDLVLKTRLRLAAREKRIPVVMVTDNGDNCLVDIERFDQGERPIFHGRLSEHQIEQMLTGGMSKTEWLKAAVGVIGIEHVPHRLLESLPKIGRQLVSQPQLGASAMMSGAVGAYIIRQLLCGHKIKDGKLDINLEAVLRDDFEAMEVRRHKILAEMKDA